MGLEVWSARISTRDKDRFDITRKSGNHAFAPSWGTLRPIIELNQAKLEVSERDWRIYAKAYLDEMSRSYKLNRTAWTALLDRERVVLTCYCTNPARCHRTILGKILNRLGATYFGELEA
jgi:uncharacterized protein YeaO (DUF488 family)